MVTQSTKQKATKSRKAGSKKSKNEGVNGSSKPSQPKEKFDREAFVFQTPIEQIEAALEKLEMQDADPDAEPLTKDQIYWWCVWLNSLPDAKKRGMTHVPTCAVENAVLGLYDKTKSKSKKK